MLNLAVFFLLVFMPIFTLAMGVIGFISIRKRLWFFVMLASALPILSLGLIISHITDGLISADLTKQNVTYVTIFKSKMDVELADLKPIITPLDVQAGNVNYDPLLPSDKAAQEVKLNAIEAAAKQGGMTIENVTPVRSSLDTPKVLKNLGASSFNEPKKVELKQKSGLLMSIDKEIFDAQVENEEKFMNLTGKKS